jgi:mannose-6-phosphate isomerase
VPQDEKDNLRPFRLAPFFRTRIWGFDDLAPWFDFKTTGEPVGEVWLTGNECKAETGPFRGQSLNDIVRTEGAALVGDGHAGEAFPLLVKVLFPKEKLSVQVHPDDAMAQRYGDPRGKTECWYALDAAPGAQVALGVQPGVGPEEVRSAIADSTLENLLAWLPVQKDDMIYVDAGTVHAIGPGVVLLETQQNSDLTYRMYDYGRPRELHVDRSIEAMRAETQAGKLPPVKIAGSEDGEDGQVELIDKPYFRLDRFTLKANGADLLGSSNGEFNDRVQLLFVASGCAILHTQDESDPIYMERCQLAIVPYATPAWSVKTEGRAEVIRIVPQFASQHSGGSDN